MLSWRKEKGSESEHGAPSSGGAGGQDRFPTATEFGEMLVEAGLVSADQMSEALAKAESESTFIGRVLVEAGSVDRKQLTSFIVKECRIPHLSLVDYEINPDLLQLIPKDACLQYRVLPIDKLGRILTLAMVNPLDGEALAQMRELCPQLKIKPILCDWEDYDQVATRLFASSPGGGAEISMSSFGLAEHPEKKAEEAPAAPSKLVQEEPAPPKSVAAPVPVSAGASSADLGALVTAMREGMRESNQETLAVLKTMLAERAEAAAGGGSLSLEVMSTTIEASITQALRDGLGGMANELRALREQPAAAGGDAPAPAASTMPSSSELAGAIRESVKGAMDDAMRPLLERLSETSTSSGMDPAALADALRTAMQESLAALPSAASTPENQPDTVAAMASAVQESLREAVKDIAEVMQQSTSNRGDEAGGAAAAQSLEGVASEIRASAETAMTAVQAALSAQKDSIEALASDYASKVKRFNTVQAFRGANGDKAVADALEAVVMPEDERVRQALDASAPLAGFSFDSFLVSKANEFSVNLARQIAAEPGAAHNPFFVFGPVGIGKTHLINAVGNAILSERKETRVGYASAGRFAGKAMEALHEHAAAAFREAYCHWDVLILDDIQFLGGHVEAQEEFFHIFNALQQEGRQIIIAADKAPDQLGQLEQRLISRFAGGMVTPLEPPDFETRVDILKALTKQAKAKVPEDVLAIVATRVPRDVRRMVGAMRKIIAFTGLVGQDVTSETAYDILSKMGVAEAVAP